MAEVAFFPTNDFEFFITLKKGAPLNTNRAELAREAAREAGSERS